MQKITSSQEHNEISFLINYVILRIDFAGDLQGFFLDEDETIRNKNGEELVTVALYVLGKE